ncbi:hypothetical protein FACS1894130_00030 [Spirochaetia bacterium]|nr:hypothetical protein FACS1894130_00030 [Spirochaetia bacterium]
MKRWLGALVCFAVLLSACKGGKKEAVSDARATADLPPFKISVITPLTGTDPFGAIEYKNGTEMAWEHLGGEINGRKIQVVVADGPTQDATIAEFERLVNNGSTAFFSGYGSIADRSFAAMCDEMEVLYVSLAWDINLLQGPSDYFFPTAPRVDHYSEGLLKFAVDIGRENLGKSVRDLKVAVIGNTRVEYIVEPFMDAAKAAGVQVVLKEAYPIDSKDYVPLITKLKNTDYDILVPFQTSYDGIPFHKKMYEMGYRPNIIIGAGIYYDTPVFADLGNELSDGVLTISYITPNIKDTAAKGITKFREDYLKRFGHLPLAHAVLAYGSVMLYNEVLKQVDPAKWEDTKLLADTLRATELDYGELPWYYGIKYGPDNYNTRADRFLLNQWQGGELRCVYPPELATNEGKIPWK